MTNAAAGPGFTVDAVANEVISCVVYNQEEEQPDPASVVVNKNWTIDGEFAPEGSQDPDFQASLHLDPIHPPGTEPSWGQEFGGYLAGQDVTIGETATVPPGCTHEGVGDLGTRTLASGLNTFLVGNVVTCKSQLTLIKKIDNRFRVPRPRRCRPGH